MIEVLQDVDLAHVVFDGAFRVDDPLKHDHCSHALVIRLVYRSAAAFSDFFKYFVCFQYFIIHDCFIPRIRLLAALKYKILIRQSDDYVSFQLLC